jgi:FkbM family methyltransferase
MTILKWYWHLKGSRPITAFGNHYHVLPETIFPIYRKLCLPKDDYLSQIVRYTDFVQVHAVFRYICEIKDSPIIIDIGAHHGAYAIILGKLVQATKGKVIAVEPNPESFDILKQNVRLNKLEDTVVCEQIAVLDKPGFANIEFQETESHLTTTQTGCKVEVTTLENLMNKYNIKNVDLLIIDVEGAELLVLQGFPWGSVNPGEIFCELHPYAWKDFGYNGEGLRKFLKDHGYRCIDMYLREHNVFDSIVYVGPTLLMRT